MRHKLLGALLLLLTFFVVGPQDVAYAACSIGTASTSECPLMKASANGDPELIEIDLPKPIGKVKIPKEVYFFSGPICIVETTIRTSLEGLYAAFIDAFERPFAAFLILYVALYAISFVFGLAEPRDFVVRLIKISLVWVLVSDNCFFYENFYGSFIGASNDLLMIIAEVSSDQAATPPPADAAAAQKSLYITLDTLFENLVGMDGIVGLGVLLLTSLSSSGQGMTMGLLGFLGFGSMILALMRALMALGVALAGITFLMLFTGIYMAFYLFQSTRQTLFDPWLKMLISFVLQPFIIFAFLAVMKTVIDQAASDAGMNDVVMNAVKVIQSKDFQPDLAPGKPTVRVYVPDFEAMEAAGFDFAANDIDPEDPKDRLRAQEEFFKFFIPKFLMWTVMNVMMASFMREVPGIAQRLGGYISAPALGMAARRAGSYSPREGIAVPGFTSGAGGEVMGILKNRMMQSDSFRNLAKGTIGAGMAYGMVREANRDGLNAANDVANGEVSRDQQGGRIIRISDMFGGGTTNRDGTQAGGIGSDKTAMRDGTQAGGIGSEKTATRDGKETETLGIAGGAVRTEMLYTAENVNRGAEAVSGFFGDKITPPESPASAPGAIGALGVMGKKFTNVQLKTQTEDMAFYTVNGKTVGVSKDEELSFLKKQLGKVDNDLSKSKIMGGMSAEAREQAGEMRLSLMQRLQQVMKERQGTAGEGALGRAAQREKAAQEMQAQRQEKERLSEEAARQQALKAIQEARAEGLANPALVHDTQMLVNGIVARQDAAAEAKLANLNAQIRKLEESKDASALRDLKVRLMELRDAIEQESREKRAVVRRDTIRDSEQKLRIAGLEAEGRIAEKLSLQAVQEGERSQALQQQLLTQMERLEQQTARQQAMAETYGADYIRDAALSGDIHVQELRQWREQMLAEQERLRQEQNNRAATDAGQAEMMAEAMARGEREEKQLKDLMNPESGTTIGADGRIVSVDKDGNATIIAAGGDEMVVLNQEQMQALNINAEQAQAAEQLARIEQERYTQEQQLQQQFEAALLADTQQRETDRLAEEARQQALQQEAELLAQAQLHEADRLAEEARQQALQLEATQLAAAQQAPQQPTTGNIFDMGAAEQEEQAMTAHEARVAAQEEARIAALEEQAAQMGTFGGGQAAGTSATQEDVAQQDPGRPMSNNPYEPASTSDAYVGDTVAAASIADDVAAYADTAYSPASASEPEAPAATAAPVEQAFASVAPEPVEPITPATDYAAAQTSSDQIPPTYSQDEAVAAETARAAEQEAASQAAIEAAQARAVAADAQVTSEVQEAFYPQTAATQAEQSDAPEAAATQAQQAEAAAQALAEETQPATAQAAISEAEVIIPTQEEAIPQQAETLQATDMEAQPVTEQAAQDAATPQASPEAEAIMQAQEAASQQQEAIAAQQAAAAEAEAAAVARQKAAAAASEGDGAAINIAGLAAGTTGIFGEATSGHTAQEAETTQTQAVLDVEGILRGANDIWARMTALESQGKLNRFSFFGNIRSNMQSTYGAAAGAQPVNTVIGIADAELRQIEFFG